jgi:hypothetical protein
MFINKSYTSVFRDEENGGESGGSGGEAYTKEQFEELNSKLEAAQGESTSMRAKMDELLGETKKAKALKKQADEEADALARAKALKDNDFEQLFKSSEQQRESSDNKYNELLGRIATDKQKATAMQMSIQLADGDNAELLAQFIAPRLKYTDDGVKILDSNGQLTVSTLEDLKTEFQNNARYSALLKGNQSSGGSASGGQSSSAADKSLTRAEFEALPANKRMEFVKANGEIT